MKTNHKIALLVAGGVLAFLLLRRKREPGISATILNVDSDTCRCVEITTNADGTQTKRSVSVQDCLNSTDPDVETATLECLARQGGTLGAPTVGTFPSFEPFTLSPKVETGPAGSTDILGSVKGFLGLDGS